MIPYEADSRCAAIFAADIAGNICGLGTPLTSESPTSTFGKLLDVLIAVWSMSVAGIVIGLVGSFSYTDEVVAYIEVPAWDSPA